MCLTADDRDAHRAFVHTLGSNAIKWNYLESNQGSRYDDDLAHLRSDRQPVYDNTTRVKTNITSTRARINDLENALHEILRLPANDENYADKVVHIGRQPLGS